MKTLLLDTARWDLVLDARGDIAVAEDPYALAQDVASAVRTFLGEVWYDTTLGIPYFQQVLGHAPPVTYFQELIAQAAESVVGVANASCTISAFKDRNVSGRVTFTNDSGQSQTVGF